ncbi:MAG: sulfotransferase family protein [Gammaproteobacteria bacterium]|nr:sulfotransferase family protein [Gammaproteobacteria bacterium]
MKHPIYALWAVPRSTSTAFEWMMRQRGDLNCVHEPFGEAWYQGEQPLWPRVDESSVRTPGLTLESVWRDLQNLAEQGPVFSKDFPHYIAHLWDAELLSHFQHSFLIRNPAKTLTSMYRHWPDFHIKETGFAEQRELFDLLCDQLGSPPPVLDSDDLLQDPHTMVERWCSAIGLPFMESALSWEPGARDEVSWWDGGSFHENLRNSDGLKPQSRPPVDPQQLPDYVKRVYDLVMPHYEHLYAHRLSSTAATSA